MGGEGDLSSSASAFVSSLTEGAITGGDKHLSPVGGSCLAAPHQAVLTRLAEAPRGEEKVS